MAQTGDAAAKQGAASLSPTDRAKVFMAKAGLLVLLDQARSSLVEWNQASKDEFKKAFGTDTTAARDTILTEVYREIDLVRNMTMSNFKIDSSAGAGTFAYVYPNDSTHTVHLGPSFWSAKMSGVDSAPGTLGHEISHFRDVGGTKDGFPTPTYGLKGSRALTSSERLRHADSFEYYLERAP